MQMNFQRNKTIIFLLVLLAFFLPQALRAHEALEHESTYEEQVTYFSALQKDHDTKTALAQLRSEIKENDLLAYNCHDVAHTLGHEAFKIYADFGKAMELQDEICNSGYIHGVIEEYFSETTDVFEAMKTVCSPYPAGKFTSWECYHGVGHGLMYYTNNNLPKAISLCEAYSGSFARGSCINGVYMENFNAGEKIHSSTFLKPDDLFYPCSDQAFGYKKDCYVYAPIRYLHFYPEDYVGALDWCNNAPLAYQSTCASGVGSQAMKENINAPKQVEVVCRQGKFSQIRPCIEGMTSLYINHSGALQPARILCSELDWPNRRFCQRSMRQAANLF